jgi:hypothetical protein
MPLCLPQTIGADRNASPSSRRRPLSWQRNFFPGDLQPRMQPTHWTSSHTASSPGCDFALWRTSARPAAASWPISPRTASRSPSSVQQPGADRHSTDDPLARKTVDDRLKEVATADLRLGVGRAPAKIKEIGVNKLCKHLARAPPTAKLIRCR